MITKLSDRDFFLTCLDLNIEEFKEIPSFIEKDDIVSARRVFADYIRKYYSDSDFIVNKRGSLKSSFDFIKQEAERVKGHTLISCRVPHTFGEKIDWAHNPTYNNYKEWPWVLNRHHDWRYLADYYILSGDESFAAEWVLQFLGWAEQAQFPGRIINSGTGTPSENACWRTLEASIRIPVWNYYIKVFSQSSVLSDVVITVFFKSMCEHGALLLQSDSERNFILHEMGSLAQLGLMYPFLKNSTFWLDFANSRLEKEIDVQVYPDGMHYEMTVHYHDDCLSKYLGVYNMYISRGMTPPEYTKRALNLMYGAYVKMARPDFFCPTMNDGDGVRADDSLKEALKIFPEREDFRYFVSHRQEGKAPEFQSCFMEYSGITAMRSSWDSDAVWAYMDSSPLGYGHHHDDRNNIQMYAYGHELLIEAGNFDYDTSEMRRYVTSSRGHNCSRVDGLDQNMRATYKRVPGVTSVRADAEWVSSETRDSVRSVYCYGYGEGELLYVDWIRKLIFLKNECGLPPMFVSVDRFVSHDDKPHDFELIWHMHDNPTLLSGNSVKNVFPDGVGISVSSSFGKVSVVRGMKSPVFQGWIPKFGVGDVEHYPVPTILNGDKFQGSCRIVTVLEPFKNTETVSSVEASSDCENTQFVLVLKDGRRLEMHE